MQFLENHSATAKRYQVVKAEKAHGATYTPEGLARFVAEKIIGCIELADRESLSILDPAIGDGALVLALLKALNERCKTAVKVRGFDTNGVELDKANQRILAAFPEIHLELTKGNFLDVAGNVDGPTLFSGGPSERFDLIIANPPYVRTQIMGSARAQQLASTFGLTGRVDLYQAFLLGMALVLDPEGAAGVIVSNRFMTTKGSGALRAALRQHYNLQQVWDLGDTKLFEAAVLPAVIVARGNSKRDGSIPSFSSIYQVDDSANLEASDPISALQHEGVVRVRDGRVFRVQHGTLDYSGSEHDVWRLCTRTTQDWLAKVKQRTWRTFGDIGSIRVGVKTCADKIFIRDDWESVFGSQQPELLCPLTTHHCSGRFRSTQSPTQRQILYPHEVVEGVRKAVNLEGHPFSKAYLESHRANLESRSYVTEAGRHWYEIWVPQDPQSWTLPKLVFRDISERPTFWLDFTGSVVNGDCYWLAANDKENEEVLWLAAAVANSTFAEAFYDCRFNNKLYSGRRRFITQYVREFPLPDPKTALSRRIIELTKEVYAANHSSQALAMETELDKLTWSSFGLGFKES